MLYVWTGPGCMGSRYFIDFLRNIEPNHLELPFSTVKIRKTEFYPIRIFCSRNENPNMHTLKMALSWPLSFPASCRSATYLGLFQTSTMELPTTESPTMLLRTNCLSVFDQFVRLALKGLISTWWLHKSLLAKKLKFNL